MSRSSADVDLKSEWIEADAVRFVLDSLGVESLAELRGLVELGRLVPSIDLPHDVSIDAITLIAHTCDGGSVAIKRSSA